MSKNMSKQLIDRFSASLGKFNSKWVGEINCTTPASQIQVIPKSHQTVISQKSTIVGAFDNCGKNNSDTCSASSFLSPSFGT